MIKLTSIQAPNQDFIVAGMAAYLAARLGVQTRFVQELPWQERQRLLDQGQIEIAWICGLPYIRKVAQQPGQWELLAAPLMKGARYGQRPLYFSDVIVHQAGPFHSFADLRGARWAYNEPGSHSGYNLTRANLARLGESGAYFGAVLEAGSHEAALALLLQGTIDATAIDSTVLEQERLNRPQIAGQIRIVATWGPSPIPPFIIARRLSVPLRQDIRAALLAMHTDRAGRAFLESAQIERLVAVSDQDYDPIREMARRASRITLTPHDSAG
jgi:phosphonate transport system substrate-binding protein